MLERFLLLFVFWVMITAGTISQITSFSDGSVLTASQLNSEFGQIISTINSLDNSNLSAGANIDPAKLSATIDGDGISRDGSTGALSAKVDDVTIEISADALQVKTGGIGAAQLGTDSVDSDEIAANAVDTSEIAASAVTTTEILNNTIASADVLDNSLTGDDIATDAIGSSEIIASAVGSSEIIDSSVGAIDMAINTLTASGPFTASTTSTGYAAIGSAVITISGSRIIWIGFNTGYIEAANSNASFTYTECAYQITRDGTPLGEYFLAGAAQTGNELKTPAGGVFHYDSIGTGTYTYAINYKRITGSTTCHVTAAQILAIQL
jgi:hypothetical protein